MKDKTKGLEAEVSALKARTKGLEAEISALKESLARQREEQNTLQATLTIDKQRLEELEEATATCQYAVMLVDGDGYKFPDALIRQGFKGGQLAAQRLEFQARLYLKGFRGGNQLKIIVRIFMSLQKLSKVYLGFRIISDINVMRHFMIGFVHSQSLFDIIEVGEGKERADHKLRRT